MLAAIALVYAVPLPHGSRQTPYFARLARSVELRELYLLRSVALRAITADARALHTRQADTANSIYCAPLKLRAIIAVAE